MSKRPAVILLAEDDIADQNLTKRALESGKLLNELHIVNNGEEALDYLYRRNQFEDPASSPFPDIMLLDLNMPKIDGRQVLEMLRKDSKFKYMTIIVFTTSSQEEDILRSYDLGVSSFITKPVEFDRFFDVIARLEEYWLQIVKLPQHMD